MENHLKNLSAEDQAKLKFVVDMFKGTKEDILGDAKM
jgi:hypothetical protein